MKDYFIFSNINKTTVRLEMASFHPLIKYPQFPAEL